MRRTLEKRDVLGNVTEVSGVKIQRLKNKLGTRALPTAELELHGQGCGTNEVATLLKIARIHNGVSAVGFWVRGLGIVRAFARVRVAGERPLWERTAFMHSLARMHVEYRANVIFNLFVVGLLGVVEQGQIASFNGQKPQPQNQTSGLGHIPGLQNVQIADHLLRLLMVDALYDRDEVAVLVVEARFALKLDANQARLQSDWGAQMNADMKNVFGAGVGPSKARLWSLLYSSLTFSITSTQVSSCFWGISLSLD